jgi:hypothetical protein
MHTTEGPQGTVFHHNGDYSGEVKVTVTAEPARGTDVNHVPHWTAEVPFADLEALVLGKYRNYAITMLESAEGPALARVLGLAR